MNIYRLTFFVLIALLVGFLGLLIIETPDQVSGFVHPEFSTMRMSGESVATLPGAKYVSFFMGVCIVLLLCLSILIGWQKKNSLSGVKNQLVWYSVLYLLVFCCMVISYWNYSGSEEVNYFLGFPAPTAWMLYGVWLVPIFFTFLYFRKFHSKILTKEDLLRFEHLVAENAQSKK